MHQLHSPDDAVLWLRDRVTGVLRTDSRRVGPGDGFIAWPGAATDGRRYVPQALQQGAAACLVEREGSEAFGFDAGAHADAIAGFSGLKASTGPIAAAYYETPSRALDVLAVTGTNGKTSTAWWLAQALSRAQQQAGMQPSGCAVIGTLGSGVPPGLLYNGLTTPDPVLLQARLREFADTGLAACAIEASSIGIAERRLDGTQIRLAVFTNFTQDHLDYHGSMAAYWQAKAELFRWPGLAAAVVNIDDTQGAALAADLAGEAIDLWTVSALQPARLQAVDIGYRDDGLYFSVREGDQQADLATPLIGQYNVSNLLGVVGALRALGFGLRAAVAACHGLLPVPGRMERIAVDGQPMVAIDYAHTPDALQQALLALRPLATARGGRLWCLFGCGGDRDAGKRPLMGTVAERDADVVVVTSDNPRREQPEAIIGQILQGLRHTAAVHVQADRARAIAETLVQAGAADVVLLAGKGHEAVQDIAGVQLPFSDRVHAEAALAARLGVRT